MGWGKKLIVAFVGLGAFGLGVWLVGIACFAYLILSSRSGGKGSGKNEEGAHRISPRMILALFAGLLSLVALASGGLLSPIILFSVCMTLLLWPSLPFEAALSSVIPVDESVLLRSSLVPFWWHAVAEVKPGPEPIPQALSSFKGRIVIFSDAGSVYAVATAFALNEKSAEAVLLSRLRSIGDTIFKGAYLMPIEGRVASALFRRDFFKVKPAEKELFQAPVGVYILDLGPKFLNRVGFYTCSEAASQWARIPSPFRGTSKRLVKWEVLDDIGKGVRWKEPDAYSNLLESITATKGERIADRMNKVEGSGQEITVHALGGDVLKISRAEFRALVALYA